MIHLNKENYDLKQQLVNTSNSSSCKCSDKTNDSNDVTEESKTVESSPIKEEGDQDIQAKAGESEPKQVIQVFDDNIIDPIAISTSNNVELMIL